MFTAPRQALKKPSNTIPTIPLLSLSGVFVWVCDGVGAREFMCDGKSSSVYLLSLCLMRCKQKAVSMQPLPALHQAWKQLAASLCLSHCFLQEKKQKTAREEAPILARQFLVLTSGNIQGESTLLSHKTSVGSSECWWPLRSVMPSTAVMVITLCWHLPVLCYNCGIATFGLIN